MLSDLYDRGVWVADFTFGKVLASWVKSRPEGIVAVTSDHGEYLGEHGMLSHGLTVYPQVVKVPLALLAAAAPMERAPCRYAYSVAGYSRHTT